MDKRTLVAGLVACMLLMGSVAMAEARPHERGWGGGGCQQGMERREHAMERMEQFRNAPPEVQAQYMSLAKEHRAAVEPKRQELQAKRLELNALGGNTNASPEAITKLSQDIARLSSELRQARWAFREKVEKEISWRPARPMHHDGGPGPRG